MRYRPALLSFLMLIMFMNMTLNPILAELTFIKAYNNPNEVTDIAEMGPMVVWTTSDCGLSRWDLTTGEVFTYNKRNSPLLRDYARHVAIKEDTVWVTSGERLFRIVNDEWTSFTWEDIGLPFEYNFDLVTYDNWGRLWVSFYYGVAYYEDGSWTYFDQNNSSLYPYIESMEPGIGGDMWFGHTQLWVHNLSQYTSDGEFIPHDGFYYPQQIAVEPDGQVWIERDSRIGMVLPDTILILNAEHANWPQYSNSLFSDIWAIDTGLRLRSGHRIYHKNMGSIDIEEIWTFPDSLPWVYFLEQAPSQSVYFKVWESFITQGFIKLSPSFSWTWYQTEGELDNNEVNGLFLSPLNHVYAGKWNHYLKFRSEGSELVRLENFLRYPRKINDSLFAWTENGKINFNNGTMIDPEIYVWDFDYSDNGILYFCNITGDKGVYYLNNEGDTRKLENCPINYPKYLCVDNNGYIWVGDPNYKGFAIFDGFEWDHIERNDPRVAQQNIDLFYVDSYGRMWCATNQTWPNYGLSMFDGSEWHIFNEANGLPTPAIDQFTEDASGNIWMATGLGLIKYDGNKFEVFNHNNTDLPTPWVRSLEIDYTGNFWVGTDKGLFILNETGVFIDELPIEKATDNLSLTIEMNHPTINWECAQPPEEFAGFHIEKSRFGNKYTRIATIPYSESSTLYSFTDTTTKYGRQYYRLVEYDNLGRRWNSLIDSISLDASINLELSEISKYDDEETISIEWSTGYSSDIKFFVIYRKLFGGEWDYLIKIQTSTDTLYTYIDKTDSLIVDAYRVDAVSLDGIVFNSNESTVTIKERLPIVYPKGYSSSEIYPNPSNGSIIIDLELPEDTELTVTVINILGQNVKKVDIGVVPKGTRSISLHLSDVPSGIYFIYLSEPFEKPFKFTLLK